MIRSRAMNCNKYELYFRTHENCALLWSIFKPSMAHENSFPFLCAAWTPFSSRVCFIYFVSHFCSFLRYIIIRVLQASCDTDEIDAHEHEQRNVSNFQGYKYEMQCTNGRARTNRLSLYFPVDFQYVHYIIDCIESRCHFFTHFLHYEFRIIHESWALEKICGKFSRKRKNPIGTRKKKNEWNLKFYWFVQMSEWKERVERKKKTVILEMSNILCSIILVIFVTKFDLRQNWFPWRLAFGWDLFYPKTKTRNECNSCSKNILHSVWQCVRESKFTTFHPHNRNEPVDVVVSGINAKRLRHTDSLWHTKKAN